MLSDKQIKALAEDKRFDWSSKKCFAEWFQRYGSEFLSIRQIQQAYANSQEFFDIEMIPFVQSNVNKLSKQIFLTDGWMFQNPRIAKEKLIGKPYLIGGRHRLFAITDVLGKIGSHTGLGEQIFEQLVRVELLKDVEREDIPELILADNGSRRVSKPERNSILVHKHTKSPDADDYIRVALTSGASPIQTINAVAAYFLKKEVKIRELDDRKAYAVGKVLGEYLLYGNRPIRKTEPVAIKTVTEFKQKVTRLWSCVKEVVKQDRHLRAEEISSKAIQLYEREQVNPQQ
ncbi:hypothetical protein H6G17_05925 [Chroococcidiopsis sp. FACHB-1243]|uniref:hypothetical protein n=1 Tax=Chroococcidiopsis sp. [FACHB-1243] TaxID=2692781 RepID=UPI00177D476C|nr:hypothetical protein [Chroococcidiopsis sp. [FACHB-1243]]MBD2305051.1 hypothetical protein [Chroococcidiopsis sp. [FACHB-1243]]